LLDCDERGYLLSHLNKKEERVEKIYSKMLRETLAFLSQLDWIGLDWIGLDWIGLEAFLKLLCIFGEVE
jgi:hypothetical protein